MHIFKTYFHQQFLYTFRMIILLASLSLLVGCLSDSDTNEENITNSIVFVNYSNEETTFTLPAGQEVIPTPLSLANVRVTNDFNDQRSKVAYIAFQYKNQQVTDDKIVGVEMLYAASLDRTVERVDYVDAPNDSTSIAPIIALDVMGNDPVGENVHANMFGKHLLIRVSYFLSTMPHYFTLVYKSEGITSTSEKLRVYLRHNNNGDTALTSTSYYFRSIYPAAYWMAFDLTEALEEFTLVTGLQEVPVEIVTHTSVSNLDLVNAREEKYTCIYK